MSQHQQRQSPSPGMAGFRSPVPRNSSSPRPAFRSPNQFNHPPLPFATRPVAGRPSKPLPQWTKSPVSPMFGRESPRWGPVIGQTQNASGQSDSFFQPIYLPNALPFTSFQGDPKQDGFAMKPSYDMELVYPPGAYSEVHTITATSETSEYWEETGLTTAEIIAAQSQDYIDEKLAEYQATIQHLQDEQERVQKKTFTNWINSYLAKHVPPLHTVDLIEDLKDGTRLLALLSVLSGEKLPVEKGRNLRRPHFLSNCNTALQFLQSKRMKLVNINSSDIVDGKPAVVLGLVWTIILYFQLRCRDRKVIEENTKVLASLNYRIGNTNTVTPTPVSSGKVENRVESRAQTESPTTVTTKHGRVTPSEKWKQGARKALLQWVQGLLSKRFDLQVNDFGASWRDGNAFLAIIHSIKPGLVDMASLQTASNKTRLETAFRLGEELGVPRLLDPEDVDVPRPDEKSIMTYVAQFLHKANASQADSFSSVQGAFDELLTWLNQKTQYMEHMKQTNGLSRNYSDYLALQEEMALKVVAYNRLKTLVDSVRMVGLTEDSWAQVQSLWKKLESQLNEWHWLLDSNLPEPFGGIGQWLAHAELLLNTQDVPTVMDDEAARVLNSKIEEHKAFFAGLPKIISEFYAALNLPFLSQIPSEQMESLAARLTSIGSLASKRLIHLKYLEHKCCLVAFIVLVENRLRQWTGKYGRNAQGLLNQYNTFVNRNQIFTEFQRAYADMKLVVDEYKREGGIDTRESRVADHFLWEISERWKSVSMELRCVGSMLEEVIAHWRRYDALYPELDNWLTESLPMVSLQEELKMNYFQDISVWHEKFQILHDTVAFLVATCDSQVTAKIQSDFTKLESNWNQLFQQVKQYQHMGQVLRIRKEFLDALSVLQCWLEDAERIVSAPLPVTLESVGDLNSQIAQIQSEIDDMDENWRNINRKFQTFLPELAGDEVDRFMKIIKKEKERLIRVRSQLPVRQAAINSLVAEQSALQAGLQEASDWIRRGEELMNSYIPGDMKSAQELLVQHRRYFSKLVYYKTMLDSKRRFIDGRIGEIGNENKAGADALARQVNQISQEFNHLERNSQQWEGKLNECVRCWRNYEENKQTVTDWLRTAEKLLHDKDFKSVQALEAHKNYFEQINERPLRDLIQASQSLRNCVEPQQFESIVKSVEHLEIKWNKIMSKAPVHLIKMEFHLEKENLAFILREINNEINHEEMLLARQEHPQVVLSRNMEILQGDLPVQAKNSLERLTHISSRFHVQYPQDSSLADETQEAHTVYQGVIDRAHALNKTLQDIPEQWSVYQQKFSEVSQWMDQVDSSLQEIMMEAYNAEQFEVQKNKFLNICRDVDLKRDDMKSLVKQLDLLVSIQADERALQEQNALENLIQRYKSLVPMIEVTMIKTETQSRCYTYREETRRICRELEGLDKLSIEQGSCPNSLAELEAMIYKQSTLLNQLEAQRPTIVSLLQAGQDLQNDTNAPDFIQTQIQQLDTAWRDIYNQSYEKLKNLKETQKVWTKFTVHKTSILTLLEEAEHGLETFAPKDLPAKQDLRNSLYQATEHTIVKLRTLCESLSQVSKPEHRGVLEHEVEEIERRLHEILRLLDNRIHDTCKHGDTFATISSQMETLKKDVEFCKRALLQLLNMDIQPDERVRKTKELNMQIIQNFVQLEELEVSLGHIEILPEVSETVQLLTKDLAAVKEGLVEVRETVVTQSTESEQAFVSWTQCKEDLAKVTPWIEQAAEKVAVGFARPQTLQEAKLYQIQMKELSGKGKTLAATLNDSAMRVQAVPSVASTVDEIETAQSKLGSISNTVDHWNEKYEGLVENWESYESSYVKLDDWLTAELENIGTPLNFAEMSANDLKAKQAKLEALCTKLTTEQSLYTNLSKQCDSLVRLTAPQTAATLNMDLKTLKGKVTKLTEATRGSLNALEEAKQAREGYETKVADLEKWMSDFSKNIEIGNISFHSLDDTVRRLAMLSEEHEFHQPDFDRVYAEVKSLTLISPSPEVPLLSKQFSSVAQKFQDLQTKLSAKSAVLGEWKDLQGLQAEITETLAHAQKLVKYAVPGSVAVPPEIESEIEFFRKKLTEWLPRAKKLDEKCSTTGLVIQNSVQQPITAQSVISDLQGKISLVKSEIAQSKEKLKAVESEWDKVQSKKETLVSNLLQSQQAVLSQAPKELSLPSLQKVLENLRQVAQTQVEAQAQKAEIQNLSQKIIQMDPTRCQTVQGVVQSCDQNFEKVNDLVSAQTAVYSNTIDLWKKYSTVKSELESALNEAEEMIAEPLKGVPSDGASAVSLLEHLKKCSTALDLKKPLLAQFAKSNAALCSQLQSLPNVDRAEMGKISSEIVPLNQKMTTLTNSLVKKIVQTETEGLLWAAIDAGKNELVSWLSEVYETLHAKEAELSNPTEIRKEIAAYNDELSHKLIAQKELQNKITQLRKMNPNVNIPSLESVNELIEEGFAQIAQLAKNLQAKLGNFESAEKNLKDGAKSLQEKLTKLKSTATGCKDRSGPPTVLRSKLEQLNQAQLEGELLLVEAKKQAEGLMALKSQNPNWDESTLKLEIQNLISAVETTLSQIELIRQGLVAALEKDYKEKLTNTNRLLTKLTDTLVLCNPRVDGSNITETVGNLKEIEIKCAEVRRMLPTIQEPLGILQQVPNYPNKDSISLEFSKLVNDLESTERNLKNFQSQSSEIAQVSQTFTKLSVEIGEEIDKADEKLKLIPTTVTRGQIPKLVEEVATLPNLHQTLAPKISKLKLLKEEVVRVCPDSPLAPVLSQLVAKQAAVVAATGTAQNRFNSLQSNVGLYQDAISQINKFTTQSNEALQELHATVKKSGKPDEKLMRTAVEKVGMILKSKVPVELLQEATAHAELVIPHLVAQEKEKIRTEMKNARQSWETFLDDGNNALRNVEALQLKWATVAESQSQVQTWLQGAKIKTGEIQILQPSLSKKRAELDKVKTLVQEIGAYVPVISALGAKIKELGDESETTKFEKLNTDYVELKQKTGKAVESLTESLKSHEMYEALKENLADMIRNLAEKFEIVKEMPGIANREGANEKISLLNALLASEPQVTSAINQCKGALQKISQTTHPDGQQILENELQKLATTKVELFASIQKLQEEVIAEIAEIEELSSNVENLGKWLKEIEYQVKDQTLKSTADAKKDRLTKLAEIRSEIATKATEFSNLAEKSKATGEKNASTAQLLSRYDALTPAIKESEMKYMEFVKAHEQFDEKYTKFLKVLQEHQMTFNKLKNVQGNISTLEQNNKHLAALTESHNKTVSNLEDIIDSGERLYSQTSPDGREIIRHQIRTLRDLWQTLGDNLQSYDQNLALHMNMLEDFSSSQDQLSKFLKDIEQTMAGNTQPKGTLTEKQAQLRSHARCNQEIIDKEDLVKTVCDRAQQLVEITHDTGLSIFITNIQQLFQHIKSKSADLLKKLEDAVGSHTKLNDMRKEFINWMTQENQRLLEIHDVSGEKGEIVKRIETLRALNTDTAMGKTMMEKIITALPSVLSTTSANGKPAIEQEVKKAQELFEEFQNSCTLVEEKLGTAHSHWLAFESDLSKHTQWLKDTEQLFRSQPIYATLDEKVAALTQIQASREAITNYEPKINGFVDQSHELARVSKVERIKHLVSQLNNRFQLLHVLSKESFNRLQLAVESHQAYNKSYADADKAINTLELNLGKLETTQHVSSQTVQLSKLNTEREDCAAKLTDATSQSEKLYADTNAPGREKIRNELRNLKEKLDRVSETLGQTEKKQAADSKLCASYQDDLQEVLNWINSMENSIRDIKPEWISAQDTRSKLIKLKLNFEDAQSKRQMVEGVGEKASTLMQKMLGPSAEKIEKAVEELNQKYEGLLNDIIASTTAQEKILDSIQEWQQATGKLDEFHRNMWEQLQLCSDGTGDKPTLLGRLSRLEDMVEKLPEGDMSLELLNSLIVNLPTPFCQKNIETLKTKHRNYKFDQDKLANEIQEAIRSAEDRVKTWSDYESGMSEMAEWIAHAENIVKGFSPSDTIEEKQHDVDKYKEMSKAIDSRHGEIKNVMFLADSVQQCLAATLREKETKFDKLKTNSSDFVPSGDAHTHAQVKQLDSRFQAVQKICKEILSKCDQDLKDHRLFIDEAKQLRSELEALQEKMQDHQSTDGDKKQLEKLLGEIRNLGASKLPHQKKVHSLTELGEKLYNSTGPGGIDTIQSTLNDISELSNSVYAQLALVERNVQEKLAKWSAFEDSEALLAKKLEEFRRRLPEEIVLKSTLDEKRQQLNSYRTLLNDVTSNLHDVLDLKEKSALLPGSSQNSLHEQYEEFLKTCQGRVSKCEGIVANHQQYMTKVQESQEFLAGISNTIAIWSDQNQDRLTLQSNLYKLQNLLETLPEEGYRIDEIRSLGKQVLPDTAEQGRKNIQEQIDISQQEWEGLIATVKSTIDAIHRRVSQFANFEEAKEKCMEFLKDAELKMHSDLQPTLDLKVKQYNLLQTLQGEVRARELEVDSISEKALSLQTQAIPSRMSTVSDLEVTAKYQQVANRVKELTANWKTYVSQHQELNSQISDSEEMLKNINEKLEYCLALDTSAHNELEAKLGVVKELLVRKDEVYGKIQRVLEIGQTVLTKTSPDGHSAINESLEGLQNEYGNLAAKMISAKTTLEECIHRWAGFLEQIDQLEKILNSCEAEIQRLTEPKATLQEQAKQLEIIKSLTEKLSGEKQEVETLKSKVEELTSSDKKTRAMATLRKYEDVSNTLKNLLSDKENQYKFHKCYKDAHQELVTWLSRVRERMPKGSSSDRVLEFEAANSTYLALMNKKPQGLVLLERLQQLGDLVIAHVSSDLSATIQTEIRAMAESLEKLFTEIEDQKNSLGKTMANFNEWKEEYERLSDWLQQNDILLKNVKTTLPATLEEKKQKMLDTSEVVGKMINGKQEMEAFNTSPVTTSLLKSHLENHVSTQLQRLNSRYQVQLTIGNDLLKKVETTYECHNEFLKSVDKAKEWIENAREILHECADTTSSSKKERIQEYLEKIEGLIRNQEQDKNLLNTALDWGEKALRNTRSDGKDGIKTMMQELQGEWERVIKKITGAKASLNQKLLEWADYNTSVNLAKEWISDREAKLEKVVQGGSQSKKANLRAASTIVQDIVCLEPLIETLNTKAKTLMNDAPPSEIAAQYEKLVNSAQEVYAKQKVAVEIDQDFANLVHEFMTWVCNGKERLGKISEPIGDIGVKISQITILLAELPDGQAKLNLVLSKGNEACNVMPEDDRELIEQQVAVCADEFDNYSEALTKTKHELEVGLVRSKAFEESMKKAEAWIKKEEESIQNLTQPNQTLDEKKNSLERFQIKLQEIFDWQKDLDALHLHAQELLGTCADSRVSNAVTEISTKYNALLVLSKEVIRRLELQYQEHQQYKALSDELNAWIETNSEKLANLGEIPFDLYQVNLQLQSLNSMKQNLEQGLNKLRYVEELKGKVLSTVSAESNDSSIPESESLEENFEKLVNEHEQRRLKLRNRVTLLQDLQTAYQAIADWLQDTSDKINTVQSEHASYDLEEKRSTLEKAKGLLKEMEAHADMIGAFEGKLKGLNIPADSKYPSTIIQYEELKRKLEGLIHSFETLNNAHDKFWEKASQIGNRFSKYRLDLQQLADTHGEKAVLRRREDDLNKFKESVVAEEAELKKLRDLGEALLETSAEEGKEPVRGKIRTLQNEYESILSQLEHARKELSRAADAWSEYEAMIEKVEKLFDTSETTLENQKRKVEAHDFKPSAADLQSCKKLFHDIQSHQADLEELNDKSEQLMAYSACPGVRDGAINLQNRYTKLIAGVQGVLMAVQKNVADQTELLAAKESFASWLDEAEQTLVECTGFGNLETINDKLKMADGLSTRLPEGELLLNKLQESFARVLTVVASESQEPIKQDIASLTENYSKFTIKLKQTISELKGSRQRWEDFAESLQAVSNLCDVKTKGLDERNQAEMGDSKYRCEVFKTFERDVLQGMPEVDRLKCEAQQLTDLSYNYQPVADVRALEDKLEDLLNRIKKLEAEANLELEASAEFRNMLQEAEKWILQTSFQLMTNNSLCITNQEQTRAQLASHEILLEEMVEFEPNLAIIKEKGEEQISRHAQSSPNFGESIQNQIGNIGESYRSLMNTGQQIKARLLDSLKVFTAYEETLESIMENLDQWEPSICRTIDDPIRNSAGAGRKLEIIRDFHNKIQGEKSRLNLAVQNASSAAASLSRPSSPQEALLQPIPDRELAVRSRLEDNIDQIQTYMADLIGSTNELELIKSKKDDLAKWASETKMAVKNIAEQPVRQRQESAQAEMRQLNDMRTNVGEKIFTLQEIEMQEGVIVEEKYEPNLSTKLSLLELEINQCIDSRQKQHDAVAEYQQLLREFQDQLQEMTNQLDTLERGNGILLPQKLVICNQLLSEGIPSASENLNQVRRKSGENLTFKGDSRYHEDQLKGLENRFNGLEKRIKNKKKNLSDVQDALEQFRINLDDIKLNLSESKATLQSKIGFEVPPVEELQSSIKNKLKELENTEVGLITLNKRFDSLKMEMEGIEIVPIVKEFEDLFTEQKKVQDELKKYNQSLSEGIVIRKKFKDTLEAVKLRLSNFSNELVEQLHIPLLVSIVERNINDLKRFGRITLEDFDSSFAELFKQANVLERDCDELQAKKLRAIMAGLKDEIVILSKKAQGQIENLETALKERKGFDTKVEKIKNWTSEATGLIGVDNSELKPEQIVAQISRYEKLHEDAKEILSEVDDLSRSPIYYELNQSNQQQFEDIIQGLRRNLERIISDLTEKIKKLKVKQKSLTEISDLISAHKKFIEKVKTQLAELSRNLNLSTLETLLGSYEELQEFIQEQRQALDNDEFSDFRHLDEFITILKTEDSLIAEAESNVSKLRKLVLLRQQYLALTGDIANFVARYRTIVDGIKSDSDSVESKIRKCDDLISPLQETEAKLSAATDKGSEIIEDIGVEDRNSIIKELQELKQQVHGIRADVSVMRAEYELMAGEHLKFAADLDSAIDWLHEKEGEIKSRPLLPIGDCDAEVDAHELLAESVQAQLLSLESIDVSLSAEKSLPTTLIEKLGEAKSLLKMIPEELRGRAKYFEENKDLRDKYRNMYGAAISWTEEAEKLLESESPETDFENSRAHLEQIQKVFGSDKEIFPKLQSLRHLVQNILPTLGTTNQNVLSNEYEILNERVNNVFNKANSRQLLLEKNEAAWDNYLELLNGVETAAATINVAGDLGCSLAELKSNALQIKASQGKIQASQSLVDTFISEAETLASNANTSTRNKIRAQIEATQIKWDNMKDVLEKKSKACSDIIYQWEHCETLWKQFEGKLISIEERFSQIDPYLKSQQQLEETRLNIGSIFEDAKGMSSIHDALVEYAGHIIRYLKSQKSAGIQHTSLSAKLDQLTQHYETIVRLLEEKLDWLNSQDKFLADVNDLIQKLHKRVVTANSELQEIRPFSSDAATTKGKITKLSNERSDISKTLNDLNGKLQQKFSGLSQAVPPNLTQRVSGLEIELEKLEADIEKLKRDLNNGEEIYKNYKTDLYALNEWVKETEKKLEADSDDEPQVLKETVQALILQIPSVLDQLDQLKRNAVIISENTPNNEERANIATAVNTVEKEVQNIKTTLESRKQQIGESLDAWHRFLQLYSIVMSSIEEQKKLLDAPLVALSLPEARQKLNEFSMSAKSLSKLRNQLNQMGELYTKCAEVAASTKLLEKLTSIEQMKTEVESEIVAKCSLLQELCDEWDRCENKIKEINTWIEKNKASLESPPTKRKPLRDQLASRENLLADIGIQKVKLGLNLEKLEVHFKTGVGSDVNIGNQVTQVQHRLDQFHTEVKGLCSKLETALAEIEKLQEEVQSLRNQLFSAEQHLRHLATPATPTEKEKRIYEQSAWREKVGTLSASISSKNQRILILLQSASTSNSL